MGTSPRKQLADMLQPHVGATKIVPSSRAIDNLVAPVIQITLQEIQRLQEAPIGKHLAQYTVTVVTPEKATQTAEDKLDTLVADLIFAIDQLDGVSWTVARKVIFADKYLAYDVTVNAVIEKN